MADPAAPSCFDLLDAHVVGGRADDVALRTPRREWTYARLLEEVAAFGGALRHCGVAPGDTVTVDLPDSVDAVVVLLACARIGAHHTDGTDGAASPGTGSGAVDVTSGSDGVRATVVVAGERHDLDVLLRAGRTDPAACEPGAVVSPYDERAHHLLDPLRRGATVDLTG